MKKSFLLLVSLFCCLSTANAEDLLNVCQQALTSDQIYQQAISQSMSTKEGVPISLAALLPNIQLTANPSVSRQANAGSDTGSIAFLPRNNTTSSYTLALTATQTVFNAAQFVALVGSEATAKGATATLNAALQALMTRVSTAYFNVLQDEDNVSYNESSKVAYAEQLDQVQQQFKVGIKTITDVYTAQAAYDTQVAAYIAAKTQLANDRENLRVITGLYYPHLATLSEQFPLVTPDPQNIEEWVNKAELQNWTIKASQYAVDTADAQVKQQFAGHLPTVSFQGVDSRQYTKNINDYFNISGQRNGPSTVGDRAVTFNLTMPIFAGGGVQAQTNQAVYNYRVSQGQLEQTVRTTVNTTRQSYLGIVAGTSKIKADKEAIKSSISALQGMEASYKVGTETLVDVLNQQQKVFQAQVTYAQDRYAFVNNILALKQAAGTLGFDDLRAINAWLLENGKHVDVDKQTRRYMAMTHHHHGKKLYKV